jgi:ABC-type multidrug transport system fused ATPase/permease subunit
MWLKLKKVVYVSGSDLRMLPALVLMYFLSMVIELAGISMVVPYILFLQDPGTPVDGGLVGDFLAWLNLQETKEASIVFSLLILAIFAVRTIVYFGLQCRILRVSFNLQLHLRARLASAYFAAPYLFHAQRNSATAITALQSHVSQFSKAVVGAGLRIVGEAATILAIVAFVCLSHPIPTLVALGGMTAVGTGYMAIVRRKLETEGRRLIIASEDLVRSTHQGLRGLKESKVLGVESFFRDQVVDSAARTSETNYRVGVLQMIPRLMVELALVIVVVAMGLYVTLSSGGAGSGEPVAVLGLFAFAGLRLIPSVSQIVTGVASLQFASAAIDALYDDLSTLDAARLPVSPRTAGERPDFREIRLDTVRFRYPSGADDVLKDASLVVARGEAVGIIGASGAGKTTLVDLLLGLIEPQGGRVLVNGVPLDGLGEPWHTYTAYISQRVVILDDTLERNIALGQPHGAIDDARLEAAIKAAALDDLVASLPAGKATRLGEDGAMLSGGQRQRVALARAFYYQRDVIVLDEATTALDMETERDVVRSIGALKGRSTLIVIAHRPQPLVGCDRVVRIDEGRIAEVEPRALFSALTSELEPA